MLEVRNLTKAYHPKNGEDVVALKNVSLKFPRKGMIFILGKSGSGKSTLLNLLGGLDRYDSGEIIIKGKSSKDFTAGDFDSYRNTYLGFIFQEYNILNEFNVASNIALALELQGVKATNEAVNKILEDVDLAGYGGRKPAELSGGQKQRVAIARALVKNPEIILADEPTGALDSNTGLQVFDTLKRLSKDKLVIVITHDRDFAEMYGDRVIELKDGEVISDIEKYSAEAARVSEGMSVVDDRIIQIKKGHRLTAEDVILINDYLLEHDALLSIDDKANKDMKRFARIGEDGNKESFKATDESKIEAPQEDFKLIKSRLPFKNSFKIGASSLRHKPFRLAVTIFLSIIAFTMFGLSDTFAAYNKQKSAYNSISASDIQGLSFSISKEYLVNEESDYRADVPLKLSDADIETLREKTGLTFKPVYSPSVSLGIDNRIRSNLFEYFYERSFGGFIEADEQFITDELKYTYVGVLPKNFEEVAISKYYYDCFADCGYRDKDKTYSPDEITDEATFLSFGPTIDCNGMDYKITAVIDTKFPTEYYSSLKIDSSKVQITDFVLNNELIAAVNYGYHGLLYVRNGFIADFTKDIVPQPDLGLDLSLNNAGNFSLSVKRGSGNYGLPLGYGKRIFSATEVKDNFDFTFFNAKKTTLEDNEILIDLDILLQFLESEMIYDTGAVTEENLELYHKLTMYRSLQIYESDIVRMVENEPEFLVEKNFIPDGYTADYILANKDGREVQRAYYDYITYHFHEFEEIYRVYFLEKDFFPFIEEKGYLNRYENVELEGYLQAGSGSGIRRIFKTAGYYMNSSNTGGVALSDALVADIVRLIDGKYAFAITQMPEGNTLKNAIAVNYSKHENGIIYSMQNGVMSSLNILTNVIEAFADVFLYIGLAFAAFSALMLTNFISTSVAFKKREIGILRAVGAKSSDVYGIFANESLLIALINFLFSAVVTGVVVVVLNSIFRNEYHMSITILDFGIRQIAIMLAICVGVALIASFIPSYRISKKKPVDAIRT